MGSLFEVALSGRAGWLAAAPQWSTPQRLAQLLFTWAARHAKPGKGELPPHQCRSGLRRQAGASRRNLS